MNGSPKPNSTHSSSTQLFIYQCVNCRLFFTSNSSFSHNCLVTVVDKQPPTYFSPIYLKFNLNKFLSNSNSFINSTSSSNSASQSLVGSSETNHESSKHLSNNKRVKSETSQQFSTNEIEIL